MSPKLIRIAFFIDALNVGGTEKQMLSMIDALSEAKMLPHLFCLRAAENPVTLFPKCPHFELSVSSFESPAVWMKLLKTAFWLRRQRIQIVQTYFPDASLFGLLAARLARMPTTVLCRRDAGDWLPSSQLRRYRLVNRLADYHLVNADSIKEILIRDEHVRPERVTVTANAVDLELFPEKSKSVRENVRRSLGLGTGLVVGIVANLNREVKRVDIFIRAAAEVAKVVPEAQYVIIGEGRLKEELEELAKTLGLNGKMRFLGSRADVPLCLSAFDVAVNTSDSEGLSNSIIEYMASGLPIVATDVGGNRELLDSFGSLVRAGDVEAVSEAIIPYLREEDIRQKHGAQARACVEARYGRKAVTEQMVEFYGRILQSRA